MKMQLPLSGPTSSCDSRCAIRLMVLQVPGVPGSFLSMASRQLSDKEIEALLRLGGALARTHPY